MITKLWNKFSSLRYVLSSSAAFVVDNALYYLLLHFAFPGLSATNTVAASTISQIIARAFSSFFNFNCNYYLVFKSKEKYSGAALRYYCLCIPQALISVLLLDVLIVEMNIESDLVRTVCKIAIEAVIFAVSYLIQNKWVFNKTENKR